MEALMDLVAASLARNGIECPPSDFRVGVEGEPRPTHVGAEPALSLSKGALTCPAEQTGAPVKPGVGLAGCESSAPVGSGGNAQSPVQMATAHNPIALPEHNYRKSLQGDPAP